MNDKEKEALQRVHDFLEEGNIEQAQHELHQLMPAVYAPQEFPKWVHDPSSKNPSAVVKDADEEKAVHERWSQPSEGKFEAESFGPIPAPGSSIPPLPGEKRRVQMPEFPKKDDVRLEQPDEDDKSQGGSSGQSDGGKMNKVGPAAGSPKPGDVGHDNAKPDKPDDAKPAKAADAKPVEAKVEEANPNPAKGPMPADNKSEETMVAHGTPGGTKAPMPVENKADDAKPGKN